MSTFRRSASRQSRYSRTRWPPTQQAIDERDDHVDELCEVASRTVARTLINEETGSEAAVDAIMQDIHRLLLTTGIPNGSVTTR